MAYIPKNDDEQQQSGMNVLAPQGQQQQQQPDAQNQPQNISGGESATIGTGQAQQSSQGQSQAPKGQQKQAKSGMFTNIRKYIDQNKPGAQRMSGKLQQNVSQQNQNIQQAINKQQTDFMSRVNQNRQRLQGAQQFGQQAIQQAKSQESMPYLQQQQQDLQQRVGQFGNVQDQTQNIENYQTNIDNQQQAYNQAQQAYNQASQNLQQYDLAGVRDAMRNQAAGELTYSQTGFYLQPDDAFFNQNFTADAYRDPTKLQNVNFNIDYQTRILQQLADQASMPGSNLGESQQYLDEINKLQGYKQALQQASSTYGNVGTQKSQLESYQDQLGRAQEQQRLFQNKTQLQNELSQLEQRIQNAPESLTEDDITRFNNLRTGIERFDDAILNLSQQRREVGELQELAGSLQSSQGRRNLMRQEFGRQGGYTSGQAALDNLILTGDQNAMRELVANSQAQAEQAQSRLQEAFKQGRITQDEMARGTRNIQRDLQAGVEEAQTALLEGSQDYRTYRQAEDIMSGLDSYERRVLEKTLRGQDGLLITHDYTPTTPEQDARISEAMKKLRDIGYDSSMSGRQFTPEEMGLRGRARTGEGTFIKELQEKLASGQGLSQEDMSILGLTGQERFAQDPAELLRNLEIDPNQFSVQDVANLTDVARADALARLSGEQAGENRFLNEQMGIDRLDRQEIEARNLKADPAEEFTRTRAELAPEDRAMVDDFVSKLRSGKTYQNVDQARNDIRNSSLTKYSLGPVSHSLQRLVETGETGWEFGTVDLNKILAGDINEAYKITHDNYWSHVGAYGMHGVATWPSHVIEAVREAHAKTQALKSAYGATNRNALRSESQSAYVGQQLVDSIRKG